MKKTTAFERWNNYMQEQNEKAQKDHEEKLLPQLRGEDGGGAIDGVDKR